MGVLDILTGRYNGGDPSPVVSGGHQNNTQAFGRASNVPRNVPLMNGTMTDSTRVLLRGYMTTPPTRKPKIVFNFMYNPNEIASAYDTDESQLATETLVTADPAAFEGIPRLVGGASTSFVLLFDRTVEVAARTKATSHGSNSPRDIGVLHDLAVFEQLVGDLGAGQIVSTPIEVFFTRGRYGPGLNFKGYITGAGITFTQFNQYMIPTRCEISIVMRRVFITDPLPNEPNATEGSDKANMPQSGSVSTFSGGLGLVYKFDENGKVIGVSSDGGRTWTGQGS
jgi:hypothetical protein